ncbi:LysR family transcriptional regulator [Sinomonas gamaensis]|uniref:LysR family transcriptional regulator n=1 Tax=Sinomonas gamaensis TaxID=2565624 RepID=UPI001107C5F3|nr:LysR family transcriptional regulator [Sinomonas gamaensis]
MTVRDWDLRHYRFLAALAAHGSIGAAARETGMAQPNGSRLLEQMEGSAGFALARRTPRGTELTDRGRVIAGLASDVLEAAESVARAVGALERDRGTLHVSASMTVAEHLMPSWLAAAQERLPGMNLTLDVGNSDEVFDRLRSGEADLGFVEGPTVQTGFRYLDVARDELVVVVRPDHPWAARGEITPEEVATAGLVVRERGSGTRQTADLALAAHGTGPRFEVGSNAALAASVAAGLGPGVVSRLAVQLALRSGRLAEIATPGLRLRRVLRAVWSAAEPLPRSAQEFLAMIGNPAS